MKNTENKKTVCLTLSKQDIKDLETLSIKLLGFKNKSALVRFFINRQKKIKND